MSAGPLSLIVFAFNEAENVPTVLPEILAWLRGTGDDHELIFVDDGSTDGTLAAARAVLGDDPRYKSFSHGTNRGIGAAITSGGASGTCSPAGLDCKQTLSYMFL